MIRKIIKIDEEKCNGCGACAEACHEGAIAMIDGKANLIRDDYCDGLGNCLPVCPTNAISFEEREALEYNEDAIKKNEKGFFTGCPGSIGKTIERDISEKQIKTSSSCDSFLSQWPIQIKLAPINAPFFNGAKLLIAADCTAYSRADFHERFIKNHVTLICCPKLDDTDYSEKLTAILKNNDIKSITVVRMEVPCCGGIEFETKRALQDSGKFIPWQVITISTNGKILD